ncbi:MAG: iron ABC transporter, partial [Planctomycetota bacterium]
GRPSWLLLDEPVSSLDIAHQVAIMEIAHAYATAGGGVIAVMHDLNLTAHYAQSVCLMHQGRVVLQGATRNVLEPDRLSEVYECELQVIQAAGGHGVHFAPSLPRAHGMQTVATEA